MPTLMDQVKIWYGHNGSPVEERIYPEAASQTFKRGDLVYLVSGAVTVAAAVGANPGNIKVLGLAGQDASGTTGQPIKVILATENLRWVLPVSTSSGGAGSSANAAATDMGVKYECTRVAAGKWSVDVNATSNPFVIPTAIHDQYGVVNAVTGLRSGVGSVEPFGWYECKFNSALVDVNV